jgi:exosortase D (VPLPA-CTERM-specific)
MSETNLPNQQGAADQPSFASHPLLWMLLALAGALLGYIFWEGFVDMEHEWQNEEYSHGYMIPLVAIYLVWQKQLSLPSVAGKGAWLAVGILAVGLFANVMGELSTVYEVVEYAFVLSLGAVIASFFGFRLVGFIWAAMVYLLFMIPLPQFIYQSLSTQLQLVSSSIGVAVIRLFDISVFLEGNVIDLGVYKLQVVEACSGLRYLFPLMSFGFLIACLYKGPTWQKIVLFVSTVPITILMNSFRIGVIGVTVEYWGIEMAEGFLHDFEGWVVFMGCLVVLFVEMAAFHFMSKSPGPILDRIDLDMPERTLSFTEFNINWTRQKPFIFALLLLLIAAGMKPMLAGREEVALDRKTFNEFPLYYNNWIGRETILANNILGQLKLTDYINTTYRPVDGGMPVGLYVAYYASQRYGAQIHSPRTCLPGGGWEFNELKDREVAGVKNRDGGPLVVNRVVMRKGKDAQVVYYWFDERGRDITSEYTAKWFKFWDALMLNRTDGALIRVIVPVGNDSNLEEADVTLEGFLKEFYPLLADYIPGNGSSVK